MHSCSEIILIFEQLSVSTLTKVILSLVFPMSEKFGFVWELAIVELVCFIGEGICAVRDSGPWGLRGIFVEGVPGRFPPSSLIWELRVS